MTKRTFFKWFGIALFLLVLASVLSLYGYGRFADRPRGPVSHVLLATAVTTPIDKVVAPLQQAHTDQTGMVILSDNVDAFAVRALTARAAGRSLDLQYYIWHATSPATCCTRNCCVRPIAVCACVCCWTT